MRRLVTTCSVGVAVTLLVLFAGTNGAAAQSCLIELGGTTAAVRFDGLAPGDQRAWWTSVRNVSDEPVDLELQVVGSGTLAGALDVDVDRCPFPWSGVPGGTITCPDAPTPMLSNSAASGGSGSGAGLGTLAAGEILHTRTTATMRAAAGNAYQGAPGDVVTTFTATGEGAACTVPPVDPPVDPPPTSEPSPPTSTPTTTPAGPRGPQDPPDRGAPTRRAIPPAGPAGPDRARPRGPLAWTGAELGTLAVGSIGTIGTGFALARRRPARRHRQGPPAHR